MVWATSSFMSSDGQWPGRTALSQQRASDYLTPVSRSLLLWHGTNMKDVQSCAFVGGEAFRIEHQPLTDDVAVQGGGVEKWRARSPSPDPLYAPDADDGEAAILFKDEHQNDQARGQRKPKPKKIQRRRKHKPEAAALVNDENLDDQGCTKKKVEPKKRGRKPKFVPDLKATRGAKRGRGRPPKMCAQCGEPSSLLNRCRCWSAEKKPDVKPDGKKLLTYECAWCRRLFHSRSQFSRHLRQHEGQLVHCDECGKGLKSKEQLGYHKARLHPTSWNFPCSACPKRFASQVILTDHMKQHNPKVACPVCGKMFPSPFKLKRHSVVHSRLRPFKCGVCGAGFSQKYSLSLHVKKHEAPAVVKGYWCHDCGLKMRDKRTLENHVRVHHSTGSS